jgi:hypothetical protein
MRVSVMILMSMLAVACNGSGPTASSVPAGITSQQRLSEFESQYKAQAEALEATAVFKFNPCTDDLNWTSTGATSGTIEISGYTFSTNNNVVSITRTGACSINVQVDNPLSASLVSTTFTATGAKLDLTTDYSAMVVFGRGGVSFNGDAGDRTGPSVGISDTSVFASQERSLAPFWQIENKIVSASYADSLSYALFEINRASNGTNIEHYNSGAGLISLNNQYGAGFDFNNPATLNDFVLGGITVSVFQNKAAMRGMIIFDRLLTVQEKQLMNCYGLYLSTKEGDLSLWNKLNDTVCSL